MLQRVTLAMVMIGAVLFVAGPAPALADEGRVDLGIITVKNQDLAQKLHQRLVKGESFETLAKQNSVGPAAFRGGRLGKVPYQRLRSEYRQALQGLAPGKPSRVIPTEEGYTILMRFDQPGAPAAAAEGGASLLPKPDTSRPSRSSAVPQFARPGPLAEAPQLKARREVLAGLEVMVQGQFKKAQGHFSAALGENPREDSAAFLQDVSRDAAAGRVKKEAALLFAQGFLAVTNGDGPTALKYFLQCKEADPKFWQGELFAANLVAGAGRKAEAEKLLQQVLKRNPKSAHAYVSLGLLAADRHKPEEARQLFQKAIQVNPEFAQAHYQLGMVALYSDDLQTAEREFKQTIALDPYSDEGYNNLGLVYFFQGRLEEAVKHYQKAVELNPAYPDAHVNLGNLYVRKKQYSLAVDEYAKALAVDSEFAAAYNNMAGAYALMGKWPEAIQAADQALKLGYPVPKSLLAKLAPHRK